MNKRPPEPEVVVRWRQSLKALMDRPPRACSTCDWYTVMGRCEKHNAYPPVDFAVTLNACQDWELEMPF